MGRLRYQYERTRKANQRESRSKCSRENETRSFLLGRCLSCRDSRGPCVGAGFESKQRRKCQKLHAQELKFKMNMSTWFRGTKSTAGFLTVIVLRHDWNCRKALTTTMINYCTIVQWIPGQAPFSLHQEAAVSHRAYSYLLLVHPSKLDQNEAQTHPSRP